MQRNKILSGLLVVCVTTALQAQAPPSAPKPDPALKKLHVLAGHWTYEGEYKPGPLGPGGKIIGEYSGQAILGGFFFEGREVEKGSTGEMRNLEIDEWNPASNNFASNIYQDDGSRFLGTLSVEGNTVTWAGKFTVAGKEYQLREPLVLAADLKSGTAKAEISTDGNTWTPFFEAKFTKAKPAPKK